MELKEVQMSKGKSLQFNCGKSVKNRFMLAPLTNKQSFEDGQLSEEELHWLEMRAKGGFGMVMTCAAHVQEVGKGFSGQLGIFSDDLKEGHRRLTKAIHANDSLAVIQLHHAGMRSPKELIGTTPVCPSENEKTGARALSLQEVIALKEAFINAAKRAKECGYDGVEVHGAHGYILTQFISEEINQRTDEYGGSFENRIRLILEIVTGIRTVCGADFLLGVRLSPERFGVKLTEIKALCSILIDRGEIDFLDISLWDSFKLPVEEAHQDKKLIAHFTEIPRNNVALTVAGKILTGKDVQTVLDEGVDFVTIGRAAILHHDFPKQFEKDPNFSPIELPVSAEHLQKEGLSPVFIDYMRNWEGFVK